MRIASTATAFPPHYFTQEEVVSAMKQYWQEGKDHWPLLDRFFSRTGVDGRYFSRKLVEYYPLDTWGKLNDVWIEVAISVATSTRSSTSPGAPVGVEQAARRARLAGIEIGGAQEREVVVRPAVIAGVGEQHAELVNRRARSSGRSVCAQRAQVA